MNPEIVVSYDEVFDEILVEEIIDEDTYSVTKFLDLDTAIERLWVQLNPTWGGNLIPTFHDDQWTESFWLPGNWDMMWRSNEW